MKAAISRDIGVSLHYRTPQKIEVSERMACSVLPGLKPWRSASAVLAQQSDEALAMMRSAADLEDASDKYHVTPGSIVPARELLGDMLLEANQPAPALVEYERSLNSAPNRFHGLAGAAAAAEQVGARLRRNSTARSLCSLRPPTAIGPSCWQRNGA
jgi:hypothetical protein